MAGWLADVTADCVCIQQRYQTKPTLERTDIPHNTEETTGLSFQSLDRDMTDHQAVYIFTFAQLWIK